MQGAYGTVCECRLRGVDGRFAVKRVKVRTEALLKMTIKEFETMVKLNHPGIVSVYRLILEASTATAWIVMELVPGQSLTELLTEGHMFTGEVYLEPEVRSIARQLFSALHYLDSLGLVHRDINPANILIVKGVVKVVDFQTAVCYRNALIRGVVGTAPYQAPEMWDYSGYDSKVDVWSAGAVLSKLLHTSVNPPSLTALSFLSLCTESLPSLRLSTSQALAHPWLQ